MDALTFPDILTRCPAAGTITRGRKDTGKEYEVIKTSTLHNLMTAGHGFEAFDAMQGPSRKASHAPFARHMIVYRKRGVDATKPHFVVIVTNSHDGLTPLLFAPGLYYPVLKSLLWASSFAVFHRVFTDEASYLPAIKAAMANAVNSESEVLEIWTKASRVNMDATKTRLFAGRIFKAHTGSDVSFPASQVMTYLVNNSIKPTLATVAAAFVGGWTNGAFATKTEGGALRKTYTTRAIVRMERVGFGAWLEMHHAMTAAKTRLPKLLPFSVSPVPRAKGKGRRSSGAVIVTDKSVSAPAA